MQTINQLRGARAAALVGAWMITSACSVGVGDDTTFGAPAPAPGDDEQGGDDGADDDGTDGSDTGGAGDTGDHPGGDPGATDTGGDDGTTTDEGGWDDTDTGGGTDAGTTGGGTGDAGAGPWEECLNGMECAGGMGCLNNGPTPTDGFCTSECAGFLDTSGCATPPPGGDAVLTCIALGGQNICALDCVGGKTCPTGMQCVTEEDDYGTIEICM